MNSKKKTTEPQPPQRPILQLRICKRKIRGKRLESLSLPHLMYKKGDLPPSPPHEKKHEKRGSGTESSKQALGGPGGQRRATAPACRPTHSPRGVPGSPFGVAMFLKRCDPAGGETMVGMAQRSWVPSGAQAGAAEERGALVTLHSGQSCQGTPGPHDSTAGTGPAGTGGWSAAAREGGHSRHTGRGHSRCSGGPLAGANPRCRPQVVSREPGGASEGSALPLSRCPAPTCLPPATPIMFIRTPYRLLSSPSREPGTLPVLSAELRNGEHVPRVLP